MIYVHISVELGLPFYFASGSDFVELFVGRQCRILYIFIHLYMICMINVLFVYIRGSQHMRRGAARIRELFQRAEKTAPCVIFIDELDALGKTRSGGMQLVCE